MQDQSRNILPSRVREAVAAIAADNTSGAAEILGRAGNVFAMLGSELIPAGSLNPELANQAIVDLSVALVLAQPDMSPLLRLASAAVAAARNADDAPAAAAAQAASDFVAGAARAAAETAANGARLIAGGSRLLTHSRSSTVFEAFLKARRDGRHFSVIATESRPMLEGRALAEAVARHGIPVTSIADAAAAAMMDEVNLVIVGADTVTPRTLINKIGTRMIVLAARTRGVPAYALCDTSKFLRESRAIRVRRDSRAAELWPDAPPGVLAANPYFEPTPLEYFTGVVTELGELELEQAALVAQRASIDGLLLEALEEAGFGLVK